MAGAPPNYRRHVAADTKIQKEMREMEDREAELRWEVENKSMI